MERTLQLLLITRDPALAKEVEAAISELPEDLRLAMHVETDQRRGVEHALNRRPDVVILELGEDISEAQRLAAEISSSPGAPLISFAYRPELLPRQVRPESVLIELMRAGANDFLRRPVSAAELEDLLRRHFLRAGKESAARGKVISFIGNKGGVGKSTISLSVACALARRAPGRVLLIDASLQHGAMCELLDLEPEATITDAARQIDRLDERLLRMFSAPHETGLRVLAAPPNAIDAAPVDDRAMARILAVARRAFDYVVVDTFPLIDAVTIAILDVADLALVVLNDFVPAILGTAEMLKVLERIGVSEERIRIVLNHTSGGFRGRLRNDDVAGRLRHDLDFVVPYSSRVLASTNTGEPYVLRAPRWWGFGKSIRAIEEEILGVRATRLEEPNVEVLRNGEEVDIAVEHDPFSGEHGTVRPQAPPATEPAESLQPQNGMEKQERP